MLVELGKYGLGERDLVANINFFSKVEVDEAGALQLAARPFAAPVSTSTCGSRWTRSLLLHAGPHPLATATELRAAGHPVAGASRHSDPPRTIPAAFAARRTRAATSTPKGCIHLEGSRRGRARRRAVDGRGAPRPVVSHRRSRRQPGGRHLVLQRRRHGRALQRAEHHPGAAGASISPRARVLLSNRGNAMLRIVDDTCGRHDTLGGACSAESNTVRYALEKRHMHSCRDSFLLALARRGSAASPSATCPRTSISS